jgi:hypothetical protein
MKVERFKKRFGEYHPALMDGFMSGLFTAINGKFYNVYNSKNGLIAKKVKFPKQ